jgi:dienelactone hydrolase
MKTGKLVLLILAICGFCWAAAAQNPAAANNGTIIEQTPFTLPGFEQIPDRWKAAYGKEAVEKIKNSPDLELVKIKYMSGGLKISGFIYKPKNTTGKKLPAVIWNRGGAGEDTKISAENYNDLYEMHRYASEGFIVLASQYRGIDGSEGRDEGGGADVDDIMNLIPLARSLGYVDTDRIFMWGVSRGAVMTLKALKRGAAVRAAVVVGAIANFETGFRDNPNLLRFARDLWADFENKRAEYIENRSAVRWAHELNVPLLIFHGGADPIVTPKQAIELAQKLEENGKQYELAIYANDTHDVFRNTEIRLARTIDWFKNPRLLPISKSMRKIIATDGIEAAVQNYRELRRQNPLFYDFGERELNNLGYEMLFSNRPKEAVELFKLNSEMYPQSSNAFDSLGEAYAAVKDRESAIKNYRKALELNPQNSNAAEALKKLGEK